MRWIIVEINRKPEISIAAKIYKSDGLNTVANLYIYKFWMRGHP